MNLFLKLSIFYIISGNYLPGCSAWSLPLPFPRSWGGPRPGPVFFHVPFTLGIFLCLCVVFHIKGISKPRDWLWYKNHIVLHNLVSVLHSGNNYGICSQAGSLTGDRVLGLGSQGKPIYFLYYFWFTGHAALKGQLDWNSGRKRRPLRTCFGLFDTLRRLHPGTFLCFVPARCRRVAAGITAKFTENWNYYGQDNVNYFLSFLTLLGFALYYFVESEFKDTNRRLSMGNKQIIEVRAPRYDFKLRSVSMYVVLVIVLIIWVQIFYGTWPGWMKLKKLESKINFVLKINYLKSTENWRLVELKDFFITI